jgi:hypothetical protein
MADVETFMSHGKADRNIQSTMRSYTPQKLLLVSTEDEDSRVTAPIFVYGIIRW